MGVLNFFFMVSAFLIMPETNWVESQFGTPKDDQGTRIFNAPEHPFYIGEFRLKGDLVLWPRE